MTIDEHYGGTEGETAKTPANIVHQVSNKENFPLLLFSDEIYVYFSEYHQAFQPAFHHGHEGHRRVDCVDDDVDVESAATE